MKIGIVTIQNAMNYGATLQTIALYQVLREKGYDVEVLDYQNINIFGPYRGLSITEAIKQFLKGHIRSGFTEIKERISSRRAKKKYIRIVKKYDDFAYSSFKATKPFKEVEEIDISKYDALICGSDQIWNEQIVGEKGIYYLDLPNFKGLKIAYAASGSLDDDSQKQLDLIKNLDFVSVREDAFAHQLMQGGVSKVSHVCDPTLLVSPDYWYNMAQKFTGCGEYILGYSVGWSSKVREKLDEVRIKTGLPVLYIENVASKFYINGQKIPAKTAGDFINLFANAKYIVTKSFHGTVFSIIFRKNFLTFNSDARIDELLKITSLEGRGMNAKGESYCGIENEIDWDSAHNNLAKFREKSQQFLEEALRG